jgi:hypothetical protein
VQAVLHRKDAGRLAEEPALKDILERTEGERQRLSEELRLLTAGN